jgi:hypothetical protein
MYFFLASLAFYYPKARKNSLAVGGWRILLQIVKQMIEIEINQADNEKVG